MSLKTARQTAGKDDPLRRLNGTADSGDRYRDLLGSLAGAILWEADADTLRFSYLTQSAEQVLGYPVGAWLADPEFWVHHVHPDDRDEAVSACQAAVARGEDHELEYRMVSADGRDVWLHDRVTLVRDADGEVKHLRGLMIDITERKLAEEKLKLTERRFAAAFNASPAAMTIVRAADRCVLDVNGAFLEMMGFERDDVIGKSARELGILADPEQRVRMEEALARDGRIQNMEMRLVASSGQEREVIGSSEIVEVNGETCVLSLFYDITERKRAERHLMAAEQKYRGIFENAVFGIFQTSRAGRFISANDAMAEILGYERGEELIDKISDIGAQIHVDPERRRAFARIIEAEGKIHEFECQLRRRDGRLIWASLSGRLMKDLAGQAVGYEGIVEDISDRKFVEEALQESERRYRELVETLGVAVYTTDAEGRITLYNEAAAEMWGRRPARGHDRWCGSHRLYHPDGRPMPHDECPMAISVKENRPVRGAEAIAERPDGTRIPFIPFPTPLRDSSGAVVGGINVLVDITARKRVEAQLESRYAELEALYDLAKTVNTAFAADDINVKAMEAVADAVHPDRVALLLVDHEGVMQFKAWRGLSDGYRKAVDGHSPWALDDPDPQPVLVGDALGDPSLEDFREIILNEGIGALAFIPLCAQGRLIGKFMLYYNSAHIFTPEEVQLARTVGNNLALALARRSAEEERERLLAELQEERERISNIIANVPGVVFEVRGAPGDPAQRIEFVSDYSEQMLGYRPEEWTKNPELWHSITHPEDYDRALNEAKAIWVSPHGGTTQYRVFHKDGRTVWLESQTSIIRDESGVAIGRRGVITDVSARKAAEEAREKLVAELQAERRRISSVISDVPGVVWEAYGRPDSAQQRIDFVSEHVEGMLGYTVDEWLATPNFWLAIVHPEDRERAAAEAAAIFNSKKGGRSEFRWVRRDGEAIWVEAQSTVIMEHGEAIGMRGVTTDITARKAAEEALRAAESQLAMVTNAVPALISYVDASERYVYNNDAYDEWFGEDPAALKGRHLREVLGARAYRRLVPHIARVLAGEVVRFEDKVPYASGGSRWIHAEYIPHRVSGKIKGWVALITDITERKRAEEAAQTAQRETERRLSEEAAINRIAELLRTTLDLESLCQVALAEATRVTGTQFGIIAVRSGEEGRVVSSIRLPDAALEPFRDLKPGNANTALARALFEGRATFSPSGRLLSGSAHFLREAGASRFAVVPLIALGAVVGAIEIAATSGGRWSAEDRAFLRRVAGHIALAVSNAQAYQSIEEAFKRRDEGVRALSHEIRTPLTALRGFSQLALRRIEQGEPNDDRIKDSIMEIASASERLVRVAEQMLSASRVESAVTRMRRERVSLGKLLRQAIAEFNTEERPCPVRLEPVPRAVLYLDPQLVRQVVWNLLSNAMKFSPPGEPVRLRASRNDRTVTVSVIDRGPGVAPAEVGRLFEKFQSGAGSENGLGLGLYLARQVVEAHRGTIYYKHGRNGGAEFSFTLPIGRYR